VEFRIRIIVQKYLGCFYSYSEVVIIEAYLNSNKILVIKTPTELRNLSLDKAAELIKSFGVKPWINMHEPLELFLRNQCYVFSFGEENRENIEALEDLFNSLKAEKRIAYETNLNLKPGGARLKAFQLVLKSATKNLGGMNSFMADFSVMSGGNFQEKQEASAGSDLFGRFLSRGNFQEEEEEEEEEEDIPEEKSWFSWKPRS